jgi:predicted 3-demethylubiquinone-9 3-methyltransferase (glyoxalase superfamily)
MMPVIQRIAPCLWFERQAEEAARFYISIFKHSRIIAVRRHSGAGFETYKLSPGSVMTVAFELDGQAFTALNAGPGMTFNEAVSMQVNCETQDDIDYYWQKLARGGDANAQQCGWLKDRYGLSWQIVPTALPDMLKDHQSPQAWRVMEALMGMKKIDIDELERAFAGSPVVGGFSPLSAEEEL